MHLQSTMRVPGARGNSQQNSHDSDSDSDSDSESDTNQTFEDAPDEDATTAWESPAARNTANTDENSEDGPIIVAVVRSDNPGYPTCPYEFHPQPYTLPSCVNAYANLLGDTAATTLNTDKEDMWPLTFVAVVRVEVSPRQRLPSLLSPIACTTPFRRKNNVKDGPAATSTTSSIDAGREPSVILVGVALLAQQGETASAPLLVFRPQEYAA
jgi:hypothetical protein